MSATGTAVHSLWTTAAASPIPTPHIEYAQLSPMLIVFGAALLGILAEAFVPRRHRYLTQVLLGSVALVAAFVVLVVLAAEGYGGSKAHLAAEGAVAIDGPALFLQGIIVLAALIALFTFAERRLEPRRGEEAPIDAFAPQPAATPFSDQEKAAAKAGFASTEIYPLTLFATGGMMLLPSSADLLTLFVALEVLSLPLYLMCALARRRRLMSQEAAMKYFLLGAFSSAFFLFGIALVYGYAGTLSFGGIADVISGKNITTAALASSTGNDALLLIGGSLVVLGLLFKLGAVPFHSWIPDVYQGAPTPVTGYMASATKVAAIGALLRLLYVALPGMRWDWRPVMWGVAILTMVAGAVIAITQTDVKRLLAYSSVAHAGFILTGVVATDRAGVGAVLFYLAVYAFVTLGAFAVVTLVRDAGGEAPHLSRWAGLGRRSPLVAGVFGVFLLAFAGIPLTAGFAGKFAVFKAAGTGGAMPLVIIGVLCSAVAAAFYIRVIVLMFFHQPRPDGPTIAVPSPFTSAAIGLGALVAVVVGIVPQYLLDLANHASLFVR